MRICDWSSDVCSSDLIESLVIGFVGNHHAGIGAVFDRMGRGHHAHQGSRAENQPERKLFSQCRVSHLSTPLFAMSPAEPFARRRCRVVFWLGQKSTPARLGAWADPKRLVEGTSVAVRVEFGGWRI